MWTLLHLVKMQAGEWLTPGNYLCVWAVRQVMWAYDRLVRGSDGVTLVQALHGVSCVPPMVGFAEKVLDKAPDLAT